MVLGEIAYLHIVSNGELSIEGNLTHDAFNQRGLSLAVLSHEGHFLAALQDEIDVGEHLMLTIGLANILADNRVVATPQARRELQMQRGVVDFVNLYRHHLLQLLNLLLHLHGLRGLIAEALDERPHVLHLLLLVLVGAQLLFATLFSEYDILVVFHFIVDDLTAGDFQRAIGHIIYKGTVVAHQHHCRCTLGKELLQPLDALNVEVVRGLVKQQHIGTAKQNLRQLNAHAPATGELAGRTIEVGAKEAKTHQRAFNLCLIAFAAEHQVAFVLLCEPLNKSHIVIALVIGAFAKFTFHTVNALFHASSVAEGLARFLLYGGVIGQFHHLRQIANGGVVRNAYHATRRLLLTTQNLQQRRLAGSVLAHKCNAVAVVHHEACLAEQRLHPKLHL